MNHNRIALVFVFVFGLVSLFIVQSPTALVAKGDDSQMPGALTAPVGTGFTYQGWLTDGGIPANGSYDFRFYLWAEENKTTLLGTYPGSGTVAIDVVDGYFTATLDFGVGVFDGEERWLEIEVYGTLLSPLQPITPAPYAIYAQQVGEHNHLGQTWLGADNPLVIGGTFSAEPYSPLVLNSSGNGLVVDSAGGDGIIVNRAGNPSTTYDSSWINGLEIRGVEGHGVWIGRADSDGLYVENADDDGLTVEDVGGDGVNVVNAGRAGLSVLSAGSDGLYIGASGLDGVRVSQAGNPSTTYTDPFSNGVEVNGAEGSGVYVGRADRYGLYVNETSDSGLNINNAGVFGVAVGSSGSDGMYIGNAGGDGIYIESSDGGGVHIHRTGNPSLIYTSPYANNGLTIDGAAANGIVIGSADLHGVVVKNAGHIAIKVDNANYHGFQVDSAGWSGLSIGSVGWEGVYVGSSGWDGLRVNQAGNPSTTHDSSYHQGLEINGAEGDGVFVGRADRHGLYVYSAGSAGVRVEEAGTVGVYANTTNANGEWGFYTPDKINASNVTASSLTMIAQVSGPGTLVRGDLVAAVGLSEPLTWNGEQLPLVRLADQESYNGVVGVVEGRMAYTPSTESENGETSMELHSAEGPAQPGDYVAVTIYGIAWMRVDAAFTGSIEPGMRLTASAVAGTARPLRTESLNGMVVTEGAPVIGIALAAPQEGSDFIPVLVTLR